jgi:hypothetical protein
MSDSYCDTRNGFSRKCRQTQNLGLQHEPSGRYPTLSATTIRAVSMLQFYKLFQQKTALAIPLRFGFVLWSTLALSLGFGLRVQAQCTVNAGAAVPAICQGGTSVALGGSFGGTATGAIWSAPSGTFSNNTGSTPGTATLRPQPTPLHLSPLRSPRKEHAVW